MLIEATSPEAKKALSTMLKKYHPDNQKTGDEDITKKLTSIMNDDQKIIDFYKELTKTPVVKSEPKVTVSREEKKYREAAYGDQGGFKPGKNQGMKTSFQDKIKSAMKRKTVKKNVVPSEREQKRNMKRNR
jgi:hypothetical protein